LNRYGTGEKGEVIARLYLADLGYTLLEENFRIARVGEIDLIAMDGADLVFVEVKTRSSYDFGDPLESITVHKRRRIRRCAQGYLDSVDVKYEYTRFDVIIVFNDEVEHIIDAF